MPILRIRKGKSRSDRKNSTTFERNPGALREVNLKLSLQGNDGARFMPGSRKGTPERSLITKKGDCPPLYHQPISKEDLLSYP